MPFNGDASPLSVPIAPTKFVDAVAACGLHDVEVSSLVFVEPIHNPIPFKHMRVRFLNALIRTAANARHDLRRGCRRGLLRAPLGSGDALVAGGK